MATNPPVTIRLRPVDIEYLTELGIIGGYGKGKTGVIRRFIENGIVRAIEQKVIERKNATDYGESPDSDEGDD